jgi:hypothetical protein
VNEQDALFEAPRGGQGRKRLGPFQRHSETSRQAAIDNYPRTGTQRRAVLEAVSEAGHEGRTREELALGLRFPLNSVLPRVVELLDAGLVVETTRTRLTSTGSRAAVLVAASP